MHKEQEQSAAKYTASGKRKFKAKVLGSSEKTLSVFGQAPKTQEIPTTSARLEKLKFKMTQKDFEEESKQAPLKFEGAEETPEEHERKLPAPDAPFEATEEDFREKK